MRCLKYKPAGSESESKQAKSEQAALALETAIGIGTERKPKRPPASKSSLARALRESESFRASGNWKGAKGRHFVALYSWLHDSIYETEAVDLTQGIAYHGAVSAAEKMLRVDFEGDCNRFVEFIAWCWARERKLVQTGKAFRRITWRLQFVSRSLLVDYRVELMRGGR